MKFERYQHVERFGSIEVEGILNGYVHIFPKLDGTNTSVYLNDEGKIEVASRNRVLSPVDDNQGACNYVLSQRKFEEFFAKYPNHRLFGEWLIPNRIRNYEESALRKLYIFDVTFTDKYGFEEYETYEVYKPMLEKFKIEYVPLMCAMNNPAAEQITALQDKCTFLVTGGNAGEGIVIKNYDFSNKFGHVVWAKIVRPINKPPKVHKNIIGAEIEKAVVETFVTPELVEKELFKISIDNDGYFDKKFIPKLFGVVWHSLITEKAFNILRKFKNPTINFSVLNKLTVEKIKQIKSDIF